MSGANVFIHESQFPDAIQRALLASLRRREVDHQFHYVTHKQARQWLALHEAHSPARSDAGVLGVYDEAFRAVAEQVRSASVRVIGLGCGGGQKDARLIQFLSARRRRVSYTACDVSVPLVLVARSRAGRMLPLERVSGVVCDLARVDECEGLSPGRPGGRRLVTFFGMIPNFEPRVILPRLAGLLGRGDRLLFSANLVPGPDESESMRRILPQYDNALTRDWLLTFLLDLGVERNDGEVRIGIETVAGRLRPRRFVARFHFRRAREVCVAGESFKFRPGDVVRLFFSCRHTPEGIRALLARQSIDVQGQWISGSGEEGVFLCARLG